MIKDQDYLKKIADICLSKSKKLGSTDASIMVQSSVSENINVRNKKLDGSERSENLGVVLTTYLGKKKSSVASSNLKESNLNELVDRCIETMKITPEDEYNSLPDKDLHFSGLKDLDLYDETHLSNEDKINYIKEAEDEAFKELEKDYVEKQTSYKQLLKYLRFDSIFEDKKSLLVGGKINYNLIFGLCKRIIQVVYDFKPEIIAKYNKGEA